MSDNDETITKPKSLKTRSEAQIAATQRMLAARAEKQEAKKAEATAKVKSAMSKEEKKLYLKAIKDKLNKAPPEPEPEGETDSEDDEPEPPKPIKAAKPAVGKIIGKPKKEPTIIYESATESESEPEVVIVKKKKPKKKAAPKTIVYEESEDDDEEEEPAPAPAPRATKSQQHKSTAHSASGIKIEKPAPVYFFG